MNAVRYLYQFEFDLTAILEHEIFLQTFKNYLKCRFVDEPLELYQAVIDFRFTKETVMRYNKAVQIIQTHIEKESPRQVNLPHKISNKILTEFSKCDQNDCPENLFYKACTQIVVQLRTEWFPEFIQSLEFMIAIAQYIEINGEDSLSDIAKPKEPRPRPLRYFCAGGAIDPSIRDAKEQLRIHKHDRYKGFRRLDSILDDCKTRSDSLTRSDKVIKRIPCETFEEAEQVLGEALLVRPVLRHSNLIDCDDIFIDGGIDGDRSGYGVSFVMNYYPQGNLLQLIKSHYISTNKNRHEETSIKTHTIWSYFLQISSALEFLHGGGLGLAHGSLKPSNILVDNDQVTVTDFGVMSAANSQRLSSKRQDITYLAPERQKGFVDRGFYRTQFAADMWTLGVIMYEMITLKVGVDHAAFAAIDSKLYTTQMKQQLKSACNDEELIDIVMDLLKPDPTQRLTAPKLVEKIKKRNNCIKQIAVRRKRCRTVVQVPRYKRVERIARKERTSMIWYKALDVRTGSVKVIKQVMYDDIDDANDVLASVSWMSSKNVSHSGIISYETIYVEQLSDSAHGALCFITNDYETMDIGQYVARLQGSHLSRLWIINFLKQISSALSYLHDKKIAHGRFSVQDVVVREDHFFIRNFAIYQLLMRKDINTSYTAPEQGMINVRNDEMCIDMFQLGVLLYELLTSKFDIPHALIVSRDTDLYAKMILSDISQYCSDEEIIGIIQDLLFKDPYRRLSARNLLERLQDISEKNFPLFIHESRYKKIYRQGHLESIQRYIVRDVVDNSEKEIAVFKCDEYNFDRLKTLQSHENIISYDKIFCDELHDRTSVLCFVYNYQRSAMSLEQYFQRGTKSIDIVNNVCQGLASALCFLHSNGVIHGKVKPENIIIDNKKRVYLCRHALPWMESDSAAIKNLEDETYMAPEQYLELNDTNKFSFEIDMWCAGVVIYEMITFNLNVDHAAQRISDEEKYMKKISNDMMKSYSNQKYVDLVLDLLRLEPEDRLTPEQFFNVL